MVISDTVHSDFLSYPFRSPVIRMDDSNQFDDVNVFSGVLATSSGCFRREPLAKKIGAHVVPDLRARRSSYRGRLRSSHGTAMVQSVVASASNDSNTSVFICPLAGGSSDIPSAL